MPERIIRTPQDMDGLLALFGNLSLPITVHWQAGADRSGQQNRLQWLWAGEVAEQLGDRDAADVQAEWKLTIGVPILRGDSPAFREIYDASAKLLTYEQKIALMKIGFSVTSDMTVRQMVRYLDEVERQCLTMGLRLTAPDPDLAKHHARYREKVAA